MSALSDYLKTLPGTHELDPAVMAEYEKEMEETVIPELLRHKHSESTKELLQILVSSAKSISNADGEITGYLVKTGALHRLIGRYRITIPLRVPAITQQEKP